MVVDITKTFEQKHEALNRHVSQVGSRKGLKKMLRGWSESEREERRDEKGHVSPRVSASSSPTRTRGNAAVV